MTKLGWSDFMEGKVMARVDGGSAGVYYCENLEQYSDAIYKIICYNYDSGLYRVEYMEYPDGN